MICLYSDFIIDFLNGKRDEIDKLQNLEKETKDIVTTCINALELFVGIIGVDGILGKELNSYVIFFQLLQFKILMTKQLDDLLIF